jgi:hypothetical protein
MGEKQTSCHHSHCPNSRRQHFILDIADSMEFPPLSTETAEPTEERFTYNDTSETVKHTDETRAEQLVKFIEQEFNSSSYVPLTSVSPSCLCWSM